jgi:hypothetical protein
MSQVCPRKVILKEDDLPLPSNYTRTRFPSTEGVSTEISNINIPPLRNSYLNCRDSFLTFSVEAEMTGKLLPWMGADEETLTNAGNILLDPCGACCFIRSITILQGQSTTIQHLDNYAKIHSMLQVAEASVDSAGIRGILSGCANYTSSTGAAVQGTRGGVTLIGTPTTHWGNPKTGSTAIATKTAQMTFALPIAGLLSTANIPLSMLKEGLTIRVQWANNVRDCFYTKHAGSTETLAGIDDIGAMTFKNVCYDAGVATLTDASQLAVEKENRYKSEPIQWSGTDYYCGIRNTSSDELKTAQTVTHILGGFTFTSTKSILCGTYCKPVGLYNPPNVPHIVHDKIRYRVNGIERPRNVIDTLAKMVQHTAVTTGSNSQAVSTGLMSRDFTSANFRPLTGFSDTNTEEFTDRGVSGVSLNSFPAMGAISGIDTRGGDIQAELETTSVTTLLDMSTYFVGVYDVIFMIEDGVIKLSF